MTGGQTKQMQMATKRKWLQSSSSYLQAIALAPGYEDIQAGRNTPRKMKEYITGGASDDTTSAPPPAPAASAPSGPQVDPKGVVYAGEGDTATGTPKKKKKKTTVMTSAQGLLSGVATYAPSLLGS